jgi:hypothetical protein
METVFLWKIEDICQILNKKDGTCSDVDRYHFYQFKKHASLNFLKNIQKAYKNTVPSFL